MFRPRKEALVSQFNSGSVLCPNVLYNHGALSLQYFLGDSYENRKKNTVPLFLIDVLSLTPCNLFEKVPKSNASLHVLVPAGSKRIFGISIFSLFGVPSLVAVRAAFC